MKVLKALWIIILLIILGWVYYLFISPEIFKPKEIEVPNIIGLTEENAVDKLNELNLEYKINYIAGDNEIVDSTYPKPGTAIYKDYIINVYVAKELPAYYMSFVGLIYDNNVSLINEFCNKHNVSLKLEYQINNEYSSGQIFYQSKNINELVESGDELILRIAVSDQYISMPNFVGRSIYDVIKILDSYKLSYNIIYYNSPIDKDIVISQSIEEGSLIKKGNEYYFDIYVSKGIC